VNATSDTDAVLLRRIGRGDRVAFEEFYRAHAPWLLARLRRRCRDPELAVELVQETFLAVWRAAGGYAGAGAATGWVWSIASHRLIDAARRRAVRVQPVGEPREADLAHAHLITRSAEDEVVEAGYDTALGAALDRLSPELRAVLEATVLDGLSTREASVLLGIPEGTVKTRARRARLQLREALTVLQPKEGLP
jgi:RNA polymerase sigma-70 factor (ECF subfamily)